MIMDLINSNMVENTSSAKPYILAAMLLVLALLPLAAHFHVASSCQDILQIGKDMERDYGLAPQTCLHYYVNKIIIPSATFALPFIFLSGLLLLEEKKKIYNSVKSKQEDIAFWMLIITVLLFLLSVIFIGFIFCEGFGCLGLSPLIQYTVYVFSLLISSFSLWFLKSRFQWGKRKLLISASCLIFFLLIAYFQT